MYQKCCTESLESELEYRHTARIMAQTDDTSVNSAARRPVIWRKPNHAVCSNLYPLMLDEHARRNSQLWFGGRNNGMAKRHTI